MCVFVVFKLMEARAWARELKESGILEEDQSQKIRAGRPVAGGGAVLAKDGGRQVSTLLFPKSFLKN